MKPLSQASSHTGRRGHEVRHASSTSAWGGGWGPSTRGGRGSGCRPCRSRPDTSPPCPLLTVRQAEGEDNCRRSRPLPLAGEMRASLNGPRPHRASNLKAVSVRRFGFPTPTPPGSSRSPARPATYAPAHNGGGSSSTRSPAFPSSRHAPPSSLICCVGTGRSRRRTTSAMSPSPRIARRSAPAAARASWRPCATLPIVRRTSVPAALPVATGLVSELARSPL
jgi:hypothetical protein